MNTNKHNRREFLKMIGYGAAVLPVSAAAAVLPVSAAAAVLPVSVVAADIAPADEAKNPKITGYVAKFGRFTDIGISPNCFMERIKAGAFDKVLANKELNVRCLNDFDPAIVLGETKDGTLRLSTDDIGLRFEIDLPNTKEGRYTQENTRGACLASFIVAEDIWQYPMVGGCPGASLGEVERTIVSFEQICDISLRTSLWRADWYRCLNDVLYRKFNSMKEENSQ